MSTAIAPEIDQQFWTIKELSKKWKVSRTTLHREVKRGRLAITRIGGNVRFAATEVARYEHQ